jgi:ketosteroid isomerase-like protein
MSEENVELFKRFADAYNRRDVEAMLEDLDPAIEWHSGFFSGLEGETAVYRGYEDFRDGPRDLYEALGDAHLEYSEIRDLGDRTIGIGRIRVRGRESGAEAESPHAVVADFRNGKAICIRTYLDPKDALEAAGLSE